MTPQHQELSNIAPLDTAVSGHHPTSQLHLTLPQLQLTLWEVMPHVVHYVMPHVVHYVMRHVVQSHRCVRRGVSTWRGPRAVEGHVSDTRVG